MGRVRDLIIVGGQNAIGKTTAIKALCDLMLIKGFSCEYPLRGDYARLLEKTLEDDKIGGKHHFHYWCPIENPNDIKEHFYKDLELTPMEPFFAIGNKLRDEALCEKLQGLAELPTLVNHFWVTDLVGGINTHSKGTIFSRSDGSFRRISTMLDEGLLPNSFLDRVYAAIHLTIKEELRILLFEKRHNFALQTANKKQANVIAELKPIEALRLYGKDDFDEIKNLFIESGAIHVCDINNNGDGSFFNHIQNECENLIESLRKIYIFV